MDKYTEALSMIPNDYLHIASSFAIDNSCPKIEPAHLLRALLHKSIGLVDYIENVLDSDYYYLIDWTDIRVSQCAKSPYPMKEATLSESSKSVVKEALRLAKSFGLDAIDTKFLLFALSSPGVGFSADQLKTLPLSPESILKKLSGDNGKDNSAKPLSTSNVSFSQQTGNQYCEYSLDTLTPVEIIGFEKEIKSMIETLSRKDRANLILIGETGVGKTSLIHGFMKKLKDGSVPSSLKSLYPVELDLISLSQGVSYKGELEDRFDKVVKELSHHNSPLLIIENFHRVMDKQSMLYGILPILKRSLSKNSIQLVVSSTIDGFTKDIEKDKELLSQFEKVTIEEPSEELAIDILKSKVPTYREFHKIEVEEGTEEDIVRLAKRYMPEKSLPSSSMLGEILILFDNLYLYQL